MATGPEQARRLTPEEIELVNDFERRIDVALREREPGLGFSYELPTLRTPVYEELVRRYREAGWGANVQWTPYNGFCLFLTEDGSSGAYVTRPQLDFDPWAASPLGPSIVSKRNQTSK